MPNEADTCRRFVVPKLQVAGWDNDPHRINEQVYFTAGRIVVAGGTGRRREGKKADYVLRFRPDVPIAVVEAKASYRLPSDGLQQAKEYAGLLGLRFAYATNGHAIVEFDFLTGVEREVDAFPTPDELWRRLQQGDPISTTVASLLFTPTFPQAGKTLRYYQETAINRAVSAIAGGRDRALLTMATGTGKTDVAFQICWKLWSGRWNRKGEDRPPRMLYLTDRRVLVDDPKDKQFAPFDDARCKLSGEALKSRQMYFATYQAIAADENRPGLYRQFAADFFDLIVVDECHRGSAAEGGNWREILEYFAPAAQLGMTATPLREDNRDTYEYFGDPIYEYTLKQGIEDGFLAPYRVHRVVTTWDAAGWRPSQGELDRYGAEIPDEEYHTADFERRLAVRKRTECIAKHLSDHLRRTDRFGKTIVFCVDQEHADEMRRALNNENIDLVQQHPDYVCRVTSDEGEVGRRHLSAFQDVETRSPVILTTSKLLTTGVDAPTVRNIALVSVIGSMVEFKQIIGRGTRVRDDVDPPKLFFTILDYTGSATRLFADPAFDGIPAVTVNSRVDERGQEVEVETESVDPVQTEPADTDVPVTLPPDDQDGDPPRRKIYFDHGQVYIAVEIEHQLDLHGTKLRVMRLTDYTAEKVRTLWRTPTTLRAEWADPDRRGAVIDSLRDLGIDFDELARAAQQPDADPLDLMCHLAFNGPLQSRRTRAERLRADERAFLDSYGPEARQVLNELLEKYADHGFTQFTVPDVLEVPPISQHGNVPRIAQLFGGEDALCAAVRRLQSLLYAA